MTWDDAQVELKQGRKVRRQSWRRKSVVSILHGHMIRVSNANRQQRFFEPNWDCQKARDWELVDA